MSEPKRNSLTSIGTNKNDTKRKGSSKTVRLVLSLSESNEEGYSEFNYSELLKVEKKRRLSKRSEIQLSGVDPLAENDDEHLKAIARQLEDKYGGGVKTNRRVDYVDLGAGYDETDPFIDNTDAYDEVVPEEMTTAHGGFYINCGKLEFKQVSDQSDNEEFKDIRLKRKAKRVSSIVSDDDEDDGEAAPSISVPNKVGIANTTSTPTVHIKGDEEQPEEPKMHQPSEEPKKTATDQRDRRKRKLQRLEEQDRKKALTVKDLLREKRESLDMEVVATAVPDSAPVPRPANTSITDAIESVVSAARDDNSSRDSLESVASKSSSGGVSSISEESQEEVAKLPDDLPDNVRAILECLQEQARVTTEGKRKFFSPQVNSLLLRVEQHCRELDRKKRQLIYSHLSTLGVGTKPTLINHAKKLLLAHTENVAQESLAKLRLAVEKAMPSILETHTRECQQVAEAKSTEETEVPVSEGARKLAPNVKLPLRIFPWTKEFRSLLSRVVQERLAVFSLQNSRRESPDDSFDSFLKTQVKPLWPPGWMSSSVLRQECHSNLTLGLKGKMKKGAAAKKDRGQTAPGVGSGKTPSLPKVGKMVSTSLANPRVKSNPSGKPSLTPTNATKVNPSTFSTKGLPTTPRTLAPSSVTQTIQKPVVSKTPSLVMNSPKQTLSHNVVNLSKHNPAATAVNSPKLNPPATAVNSPKLNPPATAVNSPKLNPAATAVNSPKLNPAATAVNSPKLNLAATAVNSPKLNPPATAVNSAKLNLAATVVNSSKANPAATAVNSSKANPAATAVNSSKANPAATAANSSKANPAAINSSKLNLPTTTVNSLKLNLAATAVNSLKVNPVTTSVNSSKLNLVTTTVNSPKLNLSATAVNSPKPTPNPVTTSVNASKLNLSPTAVNTMKLNPAPTAVNPPKLNPVSATANSPKPNPVSTSVNSPKLSLASTAVSSPKPNLTPKPNVTPTAVNSSKVYAGFAAGNPSTVNLIPNATNSPKLNMASAAVNSPKVHLTSNAVHSSKHNPPPTPVYPPKLNLPPATGNSPNVNLITATVNSLKPKLAPTKVTASKSSPAHLVSQDSSKPCPPSRATPETKESLDTAARSGPLGNIPGCISVTPFPPPDGGAWLPRKPKTEASKRRKKVVEGPHDLDSYDLPKGLDVSPVVNEVVTDAGSRLTPPQRPSVVVKAPSPSRDLDLETAAATDLLSQMNQSQAEQTDDPERSVQQEMDRVMRELMELQRPSQTLGFQDEFRRHLYSSESLDMHRPASQGSDQHSSPY